MHANPNVKNGTTDYTYVTTSPNSRDFPSGLKVWQAACLNCHDTHTVQGASRLLREGTDSVVTPQQGGSKAQEETCYQCHANSRAGTPSIVNAGSATTVPQDIRKDFNLLIRMPITTLAQGGGTATTEVHNIGTGTSTTPNFNSITDSTAGNTLGSDCAVTGGTTGATNKCGADFMEPRTKLGANGQLVNRHVECTDCHNPHRMVRFQNAFSNVSNPIIDALGTHKHVDQSLTADPAMKHTNIISGVLRGTFGVEPEYLNGPSFFTQPSGYIVKRGDPGSETGITNCATKDVNDAADKINCDNKPYVTREYQICLKCHSDYAYDDNNMPDYLGLANRPDLG